MSYLLDTNIVIHLRDGHPGVRNRLTALAGPLMVSIITRVELEGAPVSDASQAALRQARLDAILASLRVLPFDASCAEAYRTIVGSTGFSRPKILDRMIAAQALALPATLITTNAADFADIPGLKLLAW
ncbi:MAG: type II toxin-antitoxin system VapC family toxin [Caulobacter sp.]|nr:type II toxin-antitoxin system VapC family toxin [Caulobacter sp.]